MSRVASLACLALVTAMATPTCAWSSTLFDVSYVWTGNLDSLYKYKSEVGQVLGPEVSSKLRVVDGSGDLYGLIYYRQGDSQDAVHVARVHTSLLQSRGLEAAAPIRSRDWDFVAPHTSEAGNSATSASQSMSPAPERDTGSPKISDLSSAVNSTIQKMRRQGLVAPDERTAWSVYDFTTGEKLVSINEDIQLQAASLIKPFVALAFFHKVKTDGFIYGSDSQRHMARMIRYSDNSSTNWIMRQLGGPQEVQRILQRNYPGIFADTNIVEYIPANGRTYRNMASAHDYSRFLYALWNEAIPGADEIKRLMALPGPDRVAGTKSIPKNTIVYGKTGSTAHLCGYMGILVVPGDTGQSYAYTLIGIIEKKNRPDSYSAWIDSRGDVIRRVSSVVYTGISRQHKLLHASL